MSLLALIPARGGSKGIPGKNIRLLAGIPLIAHTIKAAQQVRAIKRIVVSTDDAEIAQVSKHWGAEIPFMRPAELARDDTPGIAPALHALEQIPETSEILLLQPTSPLRSSQDIEGIISFKNQKKCQSTVSVSISPKHPQWMFRLSQDGSLQPLMATTAAGRRQDLDSAYVLNGSMYLCDRDWLQNQGSFVGPSTLGYSIPPERSVDIDTPLDWLLAETLLQHSGEFK